jgi:hypothetical protein
MCIRGCSEWLSVRLRSFPFLIEFDFIKVCGSISDLFLEVLAATPLAIDIVLARGCGYEFEPLRILIPDRWLFNFGAAVCGRIILGFIIFRCDNDLTWGIGVRVDDIGIDVGFSDTFPSSFLTFWLSFGVLSISIDKDMFNSMASQWQRAMEWINISSFNCIHLFIISDPRLQLQQHSITATVSASIVAIVYSLRSLTLTMTTLNHIMTPIMTHVSDIRSTRLQTFTDNFLKFHMW